MSVSDEDLEDILRLTFTGRRKRPADIDRAALRNDLNLALAARRIDAVLTGEEFHTKQAMRSLQRVRTALLRLKELSYAPDSAVLLNPLSVFFDSLAQPGREDLLGGPPFSAWLGEAPVYLDKLQALLDELGNRESKRGRRFGSPDRVWISHTLAGVYDRHLGGTRSLNGPWGRFVRAVADMNNIALGEHAIVASDRSAKNHKRQRAAN